MQADKSKAATNVFLALCLNALSAPPQLLARLAQPLSSSLLQANVLVLILLILSSTMPALVPPKQPFSTTIATSAISSSVLLVRPTESAQPVLRLS